MRAGELRHRITIERNTPTRDTDGGLVESWAEVCTVWAAVEPQTGTERSVPESDQLLGSRMTRFRIRKRDGMGVEMRVRFGDQTYNIRQITHVETRQREMWVMGEEIGL